ncbi:hypothetical protein J7J47_20865 [Halomonas sp. ISL-60]|uniref:hypothetical protein n=1 Tax=Halomonas sp. ISL-56 TaxID=2819149 RepID=UPI001BEC5B96|nr:hypothetical protein [Halomonas sp. ISL-56]MBT2774684.1 hypothetical protein [Halomonas sp. ISL-60]MBT2803311.1 hypothetical protein [Halomonas sp. ISL-56]
MGATRIMIIGGLGAGKSRLALRLSRILDIPVYCVDEAVHDEKGRLRANSEIDRTVRSWASKHQWIIEGGNSRTYSDRASRATVLVFMKPPRWLRVYRVDIRDKLNFSLLYWSFKYDAMFGVKDEQTLGSAGKDVSTYTIIKNKDVDELLKEL